MPKDTGISWWHHVDLHVKDWLDQDTGLLRYINEIPRGALQKLEVCTGLPHNVIREDAEGTRRLQAFGRPVPFNYGCFPQTFRDPEELDGLYGAPGDDDPLDVLDLTLEAVEPGSVVTCRVLGAVCLIDEGKADWKVIVVNVDAKDPLASATTIEDVERISPGRVQEALRWIDELKRGRGDSGTALHFNVHNQERARRLVQDDHAAWARLVAEAGPDGWARGRHWVRCPQESGKPPPQVLRRQPTPLGGTMVAGAEATLANEVLALGGAPRGGEAALRRRRDSAVSSASASTSRSRTTSSDSASSKASVVSA